MPRGRIWPHPDGCKCAVHPENRKPRGPDLQPRKMYRRKTVAERFWAFVDRSGDCWIWTGKRSGHNGGYGLLGNSDTKKKFLAHRLSWEMHNGPIPGNLCVLHRCDNPGCVRPDHLWLGTHVDNMRDMQTKGRSRWARIRKEVVS